MASRDAQYRPHIDIEHAAVRAAEAEIEAYFAARTEDELRAWLRDQRKATHGDRAKLVARTKKAAKIYLVPARP